VVNEIDSELARARVLLQDSSKSPVTSKSVVAPDTQAIKKKERSTVFDVSTSIDTLREKQTHLHEQHRKLQEQYAHKLKQIEKMKSQKVEIQKLQVLEAERRKIYEMEQKLKTLEREQWKEQQSLRKELQQIDVRNHNTLNSVNAKDRGELFSLKQELARPSAAATAAAAAAATTGAGAGILSYIYDKWSALSKMPMGEVIDIPRRQPSSQAVPIMEIPTKSVPSSPNYSNTAPLRRGTCGNGTNVVALGCINRHPTVVESSEVKSAKSTEPPVKNTMTYAGRYIYLGDFPESEFADGERVILVASESYVIPFDAAWLDTQCNELTIDSECLSACSKVGGDDSANKYIHDNYKTRIVTNMGLMSGSRGLDFYMGIVAQRSNKPTEALATLSMFYSLVTFYEANR
jgi:hypothetical protein